MLQFAFLKQYLLNIVVLFCICTLCSNTINCITAKQALGQFEEQAKQLANERGLVTQATLDMANQNKKLTGSFLETIQEKFNNTSMLDEYIDNALEVADTAQKALKMIKELFFKEGDFQFRMFKFMHDIIDNRRGDSESHYFTPKEPKPLSEDKKKIPVKERITKKYIGAIPSLIEDVIFYFSHFEECQKNNITIHNRILLHGKPGTGKSHLVRVLAEELELPLLSFTASFFSDKYMGESSRRIRKAFEIAKNYDKPLLIFIDEIDALATKRKDETQNEHRAMLLTLLTELQDLQENSNVYIFAATNDFKSLDSAVKDRFAGSICEIKDLTIQERAQLFIKEFADKDVEIEYDLAYRLAEVIRPSLFSSSKDDDSRFSNRDIKYIVTGALLKRFAGSLDGTKKHLCAYIRAAMDATSKKGRFAWLSPSYCDGI